MTIQATLLAAAHVQSRLVVIARVPDMPSAGIEAGLATLTSHFGVVGEVTERDVDVPVHALVSNANR
jgi:hypothetical protein